MIDKQLLEILRCPQDHSLLTEADAELVAQINREIAAGRVVNVGGHRVEKQLDGGLVREMGDVMYPVVDQIPVMLPDEAIKLTQIDEDW